MALKGNREVEGIESLAMNNCMRLLVDNPAARAFKCKICDRQFNSFQALGGHTAGHSTKPGEPPKSRKPHQCSICGNVFGSGQALGGHMRKHRSDPSTSEELTSTSDLTIRADVAEPKEGLKESKTRRCLDLDLNLLPNVEVNSFKLRYDDLVEKENYWKLDLTLNSLHYEDLTLKEKDTNLDYEDLTLKDDNNLDRVRLQERDFELEYYEFF